MDRVFVHLELNTDDVARAREFYRDVLGWDFQDVPIAGESYTQIVTPRPPAGGIQIKPPGVPSHWMPYVGVDNVREVVARAEASGARIIAGYSAVPGYGAIAIITDPSGATFGVWQVRAEGEPAALGPASTTRAERDDEETSPDDGSSTPLLAPETIEATAETPSERPSKRRTRAPKPSTSRQLALARAPEEADVNDRPGNGATSVAPANTTSAAVKSSSPTHPTPPAEARKVTKKTSRSKKRSVTAKRADTTDGKAKQDVPLAPRATKKARLSKAKKAVLARRAVAAANRAAETVTDPPPPRGRGFRSTRALSATEGRDVLKSSRTKPIADPTEVRSLVAPERRTTKPVTPAVLETTTWRRTKKKSKTSRGNWP